MKKKNIIIGGAVIAVLIAGIIALLMINPTEDDVEKKEISDSASEVILKLETADEIILETSAFDINFINDGESWSIDGIDKESTSQSKVKAFVMTALSYASNTILNGDESEYGLDEPDATITIKADGIEHIVRIGDVNASGDVCFASVDGKIFTMGMIQRERLMNDISYYTEFARVSIKGDEITTVVIADSDRTIELYVPEITRLEGNVWQMKQPYEVMANDTFIDSDILPSLEAVTLSKKSEKLGTESATVTVKTADKEYEFRLGSVADGQIAVEYEGAVYLEPADLFAFTEAEIFGYMNKLVSYVNIEDVNSVLMEYDGALHTLDINGNTFIADDVRAKADAGRYFYTFLIGVVANGLYNGEELGESLLKVTFECKNNETITVEYRMINEYSVAVVKNGETIFVTGLYDVEDLINKINQFYM